MSVKFHLNQYLNSNSPKNGQFYTIAIDGRGGAGKSKLGDLLQERLKDFVIINGDAYFEPVKNQIVWGAFNDDRFAEDVILPIQKSNEFTFRPYDWHNEPHLLKIPIAIKKGIVIERCYSFGFDIDWDIKIWVETPIEIARARGLARETMPKERVRLAWDTVWQPLETTYIKQTHPQEAADVVLDGTQSFEDQIDF